MARQWMACAAYIVLASAGAIDAQDANANLSKLPAAVRQAVEAETRGATIKNVSKETEAGKTVYEVETVVGGKTRDIVFAADGKVLVVEEQASLDQLPAACRATIEKQAAGGKIKRVELVKKGGNVTYEAIIVKGSKTSEVIVNADGRIEK